MLKPVRRHVLSCAHRAKGRAWKKCSCPIWVEGRLKGVRIRKSLDTHNWEFANEKILDMEAGESSRKESSVSNAVEDFISDCRARMLDDGTVQKYQQVLTPLQTFCANRGISSVRALDLALLRSFVASLTDSAITIEKKIERLRSFGRHCEEMGWADGVPAKKLKKPVSRDKGVVPFSVEQWQAIRNAIGLYPERN